MVSLASLRIQSRLMLMLAFSVVTMVVLGLFSAWTIKGGSDQATSFIDAEFESVRALGEVRAAVGNARRYEKDLFLTMGVEEETERYTKLWTSEVVNIRKSIEHATSVAMPAEQQLLIDMQKGIDNYDIGFKGILGKIARGELNDPWAANTAMTPLKDDVRRADAKLAELTESLQKRAAQRRAEFTVTAGRAPWLVLGATAVVAVVSLVLAMAVVRSIVTPIADLQRTARQWGSGDLRRGIAPGGHDEIADVKRDLGAMHGALVALIEHVKSGVDVVGTNIQEIATANSDLSERTEAGAVALQKTAASVDQLSAAVRQTAQSASEAAQRASSAKEVATQGGDVVSKVIVTMGEINASSQKIADIISVIDGIAFQTNILALNAAVEAARAGEQGRGFAVVASEVRSLAGRSADAAREIKSIIVSSGEKVEEGAALVEAAGRTMRDIVHSVGEVAHTIETIRVAANDQSEGIGLIVVAMQGIDRSTQQNAAMVEESAAGALSLAEEAQRLRAAIAEFQLADDGQIFEVNRLLAL